MGKKPLVSAITPTYKRPKKLNRAVKSALNQTYKNLEIIVINDDPATDVNDILNFKDERIVTINNEKNKGAPAARNIGIKKSKGKYIGFLDDDDLWLPKKTEKQIEKFEELDDSYGLVYTWAKVISPESIKDKKPQKEGDVYLDLLKSNFSPGGCSYLIKRKVFGEVGLFDEQLKSAQEWELGIRIAKKYKFSFVPEILSVYYQNHPDRISTNPKRRYQGGEHVIKKHISEFEKHPRHLSKYYKTRGVHLAQLGAEKNICSKYFRNSFKYNKRDVMALGYFFISQLPKNAREKIFTKVKEYYQGI